MHIKRKKLVDPVVIRVACFCFCFGNTLDYNFDRNYRTYKLLWYKGQAWIIKSGRPRLKVEEPDKKSSGKTKSEGVNWLVRFFFSVINKTKGTLSQQNGEPAPPSLFSPTATFPFSRDSVVFELCLPTLLVNGTVRRDIQVWRIQIMSEIWWK